MFPLCQTFFFSGKLQFLTLKFPSLLTSKNIGEKSVFTLFKTGSTFGFTSTIVLFYDSLLKIVWKHYISLSLMHIFDIFFQASTNTGRISYFDIRKPGKSLFNFKAHDDAIPALSFTSSLLFSGSSDGFVKVWNINSDAAELKCEKQMNMVGICTYSIVIFHGRNYYSVWN